MMTFIHDLTMFLNQGATGISVSLVLSLLSYLAGRKQGKKASTVQEYVQWLGEVRHRELVDGQDTVLEILQAQGDQAEIVRRHVQRLMDHMETQVDKLEEISRKVGLIDDVNKKADRIIEELSKQSSPSLRKGQVGICADVLNLVSTQMLGAGVKSILEAGPEMAAAGTILVCWQLGEQSPNMMLLDLVGSVKKNRLSIILNDDHSVRLQVYDGQGGEFLVVSKSYAPSEYLLIFATWSGRHFTLRINGTDEGEFNTREVFGYLGPFCLFGMDIEGKLSADAIRWAPPGQPVGLQLMKSGVWHGSLLDQIVMFSERLTAGQMDKFLEDPYALIRPPPEHDVGEPPQD